MDRSTPSPKEPAQYHKLLRSVEGMVEDPVGSLVRIIDLEVVDGLAVRGTIERAFPTGSDLAILNTRRGWTEGVN